MLLALFLTRSACLQIKLFSVMVDSIVDSNNRYRQLNSALSSSARLCDALKRALRTSKLSFKHSVSRSSRSARWWIFCRSPYVTGLIVVKRSELCYIRNVRNRWKNDEDIEGIRPTSLSTSMSKHFIYAAQFRFKLPRRSKWKLVQCSLRSWRWFRLSATSLIRLCKSPDGCMMIFFVLWVTVSTFWYMAIWRIDHGMELLDLPCSSTYFNI